MYAFKTFSMFLASVTLLSCSLAEAMTAGAPAHRRAWAANVIVPQARSFSTTHGRQTVKITRVDVGVVVLNQVATTTMEISLDNPTSSRQESELVVPVPEGCVVKGLDFQGAAKEPTAKLLTKIEARRIYDGLVSKIRDPALLEFTGYNLIRTSVFPVEAKGKQKVRLTYEHLLPADGNRVDYVLPRSESLQYSVPWHISVKISSKRAISTIYSPSHNIETVRRSSNVISARLAKDAVLEPGPFHLSYLAEGKGVSASLFAYPNLKTGGGYFLLLAGLPSRPQKDIEAAQIKREITVVMDRSGSMNGEKLKQAKEAALQVIAGLQPGEAFNLIAYNEAVDPFAHAPVIKSPKSEAIARTFIDGIQARGGTNIHDALLVALRQKTRPGFLPIVLFLTDGRPTIGQTSEAVIRDLAVKHNPHRRRIFTFGVGVDVNTPLLKKVADLTRATSSFVLPKEDVEVKVGAVFKRLSGPILADPSLTLVNSEGGPAMGRVRDLLPSALPDLYRGDQLVLLGQYVTDKALQFRLTGNYLGKKRTFSFNFDLDGATVRNAFVPRLWASRKIAVLIDAIRQLGAEKGVAANTNAIANDPRTKELVEDVVRLSKEFGILTEYTAFLALEGTDLGKMDQILADANGNFMRRAVACRYGLDSVNQSFNSNAQTGQYALNRGNKFWDAKMNRVQITHVQQIADRTYYRRGNRWLDSRVAGQQAEKEPDVVVKYGSKAFEELKKRLAKKGRQGSLSIGKEVVIQEDGKVYDVSW